MRFTVDIERDGTGRMRATVHQGYRTSARDLNVTLERAVVRLAEYVELGDVPIRENTRLRARVEHALAVCERDGYVTWESLQAESRRNNVPLNDEYAKVMLRQIARRGYLVPLVRTGHRVPGHYARAER